MDDNAVAVSLLCDLQRQVIYLRERCAELEKALAEAKEPATPE